MPPSIGRNKMKRYFKKPSGYVFEYDPNRHDIKSLKDRFEEVDEKGVKKKKKKSK